MGKGVHKGRAYTALCMQRFRAPDPALRVILGLGQATKLARDMVTRYGMSDALGCTSIDYEDGRSLSGETRALVEKEVRPRASKARDVNVTERRACNLAGGMLHLRTRTQSP